MALRSLSLCSGIGGLDLGLKLALGDDVRVVCYVEREAYAAALLVARMEESALDTAPVWDDLDTFDPKPWRGAVDIVVAGFPCQPWSVAGDAKGYRVVDSEVGLREALADLEHRERAIHARSLSLARAYRAHWEDRDEHRRPLESWGGS